jgi:hypothetical protein
MTKPIMPDPTHCYYCGTRFGWMASRWLVRRKDKPKWPIGHACTDCADKHLGD